MLSRLSNFGRDVAWYFGLGDGSKGRQNSGRTGEQASWTAVLLQVGPFLVVFEVLRRVLPLHDDIAGVAGQVGIFVVLAIVWAQVLLAITRHNRNST
jgi:hypothetical protein